MLPYTEDSITNLTCESIHTSDGRSKAHQESGTGARVQHRCLWTFREVISAFPPSRTAQTSKCTGRSWGVPGSIEVRFGRLETRWDNFFPCVLFHTLLGLGLTCLLSDVLKFERMPTHHNIQVQISTNIYWHGHVFVILIRGATIYPAAHPDSAQVW